MQLKSDLHRCRVKKGTWTAFLTLELIRLGIQANDLSWETGARNAIVADEDALACRTRKPLHRKP